MKTEKPLNKSLLRAFLLQLTIISVVAVGGVYIAEFAIREVLIDIYLIKKAGKSPLNLLALIQVFTISFHR